MNANKRQNVQPARAEGMTLLANGHSCVPPGFRFHPTDEELINYYLRKKVASEKIELDVIREVDLNKLEPWDLHERCKIDSTQTDWYFFSHKDKKYPSGTRTNRATAAGFWKATGRDKAVHSNLSCIGMRKTLVFYRGRAPHGQKTDWIMHEYRLEESESGTQGNDGWVVCHVFTKHNHQQKGCENHGTSSEEEQAGLQKLDICRHLSRNGKLGKPFNCKQEIKVEDYGLPQFPFLQLPHLESPKINGNAPWSNPASDIRRIFTDNCKITDLASPFSLELTAVEGSKALFVPEDNLADYADSGQLTEWGMLESITKDMRDNADISNFSGDIQYSLHHRQQPTDYPTSCELELWNFAR